MRQKNNADWIICSFGGRRESAYQIFPLETMFAFTGHNLILINIASFMLLPVLTALSEG